MISGFSSPSTELIVSIFNISYEMCYKAIIIIKYLNFLGLFSSKECLLASQRLPPSLETKNNFIRLEKDRNFNK